MMDRPSHLQLIIENPSKLFWSVYETLAHLILLSLHRLLLPFACRATSLRNEIARCFLGSFLANFWDLLFKAPANLRESQYSSLTIRADVVLLYAHGGGYYFGEPLMYITTYERWICEARRLKLRLAIISVDYRLSTKAKWPACRDDFLSTYFGLIADYDIDPRTIVFGGDSAGGGLVAMAALEAGRKSPRGVQAVRPGGMVMISPWVDLVMAATLSSPAMSTDYLITFRKDNPMLVKQFLPPDMDAKDPAVSPIFDDLTALPPQLVVAGTAEVLITDSTEWVRRSREAGNSVELVLGQGEMHIYAMGWPFCSRTVQQRTDAVIIGFLRRIGKAR